MDRFFQAAQNGDTEAVNRYLDKIPAETRKEVIDTLDPTGNTALHYTAIGGFADICSKLIELEASLDIANIYKETPLHLAAQNNHSNIVKLFVDNGAIIDAKVSILYFYDVLHY